MQALGTFCEFKYGKSLPDKSRKGGAFPVYGSNGIVGYHDVPLTKGATIIIGRKGSAGALQYSPISCCPIDTTYYVDQTCTKVDLRWLFFTLQNLGLDNLNKHVAVPGLNRNDAYEKDLLVPPHDEQKQIAAVLDKADALRHQRQESLQLTEKLLESIFIDMFVRNPAKASWIPKTIEWLAKDDKGSIRTGPFGSQLLHSEFVDRGIAVLGIDNAVKNRFEWGQARFITPKKYESLKRYKVFPGDVIITIMGTCGRCAIVPKGIPEAINTKHLCCITLNRDKCLPEFLHACFLNHPEVLKQLGIRAKGAVMPGLNMGIIKGLTFPLPPIELQEEFKKIVLAQMRMLADVEASQVELNKFFPSLQQRAFGGELDLSRLSLFAGHDHEASAEIEAPAERDQEAAAEAQAEHDQVLAQEAAEAQAEREKEAAEFQSEQDQEAAAEAKAQRDHELEQEAAEARAERDHEKALEEAELMAEREKEAAEFQSEQDQEAAAEAKAQRDHELEQEAAEAWAERKASRKKRVYIRQGGFIAPPEIEAQMMALEFELETNSSDSIPWSQDYFKYRILSQQLGPSFSFAQIWEKVLSDIEEPDYDTIKDKVFEYVEQGLLEQRFDEETKRIVFRLSL